MGCEFSFGWEFDKRFFRKFVLRFCNFSVIGVVFGFVVVVDVVEGNENGDLVLIEFMFKILVVELVLVEEVLDLRVFFFVL